VEQDTVLEPVTLNEATTMMEREYYRLGRDGRYNPFTEN
jgi:hypothetical protein